MGRPFYKRRVAMERGVLQSATVTEREVATIKNYDYAMYFYMVSVKRERDIEQVMLNLAPTQAAANGIGGNSYGIVRLGNEILVSTNEPQLLTTEKIRIACGGGGANVILYNQVWELETKFGVNKSGKLMPYPNIELTDVWKGGEPYVLTAKEKAIALFNIAQRSMGAILDQSGNSVPQYPTNPDGDPTDKSWCVLPNILVHGWCMNMSLGDLGSIFMFTENNADYDFVKNQGVPTKPNADGTYAEHFWLVTCKDSEQVVELTAAMTESATSGLVEISDYEFILTSTDKNHAKAFKVNYPSIKGVKPLRTLYHRDFPYPMLELTGTYRGGVEVELTEVENNKLLFYVTQCSLGILKDTEGNVLSGTPNPTGDPQNKLWCSPPNTKLGNWCYYYYVEADTLHEWTQNPDDEDWYRNQGIPTKPNAQDVLSFVRGHALGYDKLKKVIPTDAAYHFWIVKIGRDNNYAEVRDGLISAESAHIKCVELDEKTLLISANRDVKLADDFLPFVSAQVNNGCLEAMYKLKTVFGNEEFDRTPGQIYPMLSADLAVTSAWYTKHKADFNYGVSQQGFGILKDEGGEPLEYMPNNDDTQALVNCAPPRQMVTFKNGTTKCCLVEFSSSKGLVFS